MTTLFGGGGGGIVGGHTTVAPASYRSAESGQIEISKYHLVAVTDTYETIHTVTTGKSFYLTTIIIGHSSSTTKTLKIATGGAGAETDVFVVIGNIERANMSNFVIELNIPIKFTSGTRLSVYGVGTASYFTLIGFEE